MVKCTQCKELDKTVNPKWCNYLKAFMSDEVILANQSKDLACKGFKRKKK